MINSESILGDDYAWVLARVLLILELVVCTCDLVIGCQQTQKSFDILKKAKMDMERHDSVIKPKRPHP